MKGGDIFGSEQLAMNMSVYIDEIETEFLPLNCNWITSNLLPKFDEENSTFVEPYLPNHKIGIVHFAGKNNDLIRNNKDHISKIKTIDGEIIEKKLRFNN